MKKHSFLKRLFIFALLLAFVPGTFLYSTATTYGISRKPCDLKYKPPLSGLVAMGSVSDLRKGIFDVLKEVRVHPDIYSGVVIHTTWGALEPEQGKYDFSTIDKALSDITQYNKEHPLHPIFAKLRISKAINPPEWVLKLAGGPVNIVLNNGQTIQVGLYWTEEYRNAWKALQQKLASRYDDNILIREVCVNSGAMITDEPFVAIFNKATIANLKAKGYTDAAFKATLKGALDDYACWKNTPIDYSFNVLREIDSGKPVNNMDFTLSLMREFRERYGERAVLSNHGLQETLSKGAIPIYNLFAELGAPIAVQTKGPSDLTDKTIKTGLKYGVTEFEIWVSKEAGGYADYSKADLERWAQMIQSSYKMPKLSVSAPADTQKSKITIKGTSKPNTLILINGRVLYTDKSGAFSMDVSLEKGKNTFSVIAINRVGNETIKTVTVTYEEPSRKIVITLHPKSPIMTVNGVQKEIDPGRGTAPVIIPKWGRTVVPIRAIVEALGGTIEWDGTERKVTINFNGTSVELWINKPRAMVNGKVEWIDPSNHDVRPIIVNNRTMLPLRFVAESLGCKVEWNASTRTITIIYAEP